MFRSKSYRSSKSCAHGGVQPEKEQTPFFTPRAGAPDRQAPHQAPRQEPHQAPHQEPHQTPLAKSAPKQEPPVPVIPQLSAKPSYVNNEGCSDLTFGINWDLSHNSSPKGGFIVQEVTITYMAIDCHGYPVPLKFKSPLHYFEAWQVMPDSTGIAPENADGFHFSAETRDHTAHTIGVAIFSAAATYHDNVSPEEMPGHMVRKNPHTAAGILLSSTSDPNLGGNISKSIPHELTYHWSCCEPGMKPNVIDKQTPS
ncbi:MAG TPA: hypothetical protein VGN00_19565 [Puia sp.]|jgi:hypothetical protein